jgi:hypothetical protein
MANIMVIISCQKTVYNCQRVRSIKKFTSENSQKKRFAKRDIFKKTTWVFVLTNEMSRYIIFFFFVILYQLL